MHLYGGTLPDQHATLHPSLLRVSMPEVSHSCSYCGAAVGCLLGLLVVRGRYAKKRLTAPYLESSVSATPLLRGKHLIGGSFLLGDGVLGILSCLQEKSVASSRRFPQRMCGYSCAAAATAAHAQDKVACQSLARGHLERWGKRWLQLSS